jgi:hypothetical protein
MPRRQNAPDRDRSGDHDPHRDTDRHAAMFRSAEDAWFWTMAALQARHSGANHSSGGRLARPCEPDDVVRCLDHLFRGRRVAAEHARAMKRWGERGVRPDPARPAERRDFELWFEAMSHLDRSLRAKGIVAQS